MATATQIKTAVDDEILTRVQNGLVSRYQLSDGRSVQREGVDALLRLRAEFTNAAESETYGSSLARTRVVVL